MKHPRLMTFTLGCRVNQYETECVRQALLQPGYRDAGADRPADLCIVNTCTVTLEGDYKGRKLIRALARKHPRAEIVVMGCYATRALEELAVWPGVLDVVTDGATCRGSWPAPGRIGSAGPAGPGGGSGGGGRPHPGGGAAQS